MIMGLFLHTDARCAFDLHGMRLESIPDAGIGSSVASLGLASTDDDDDDALLSFMS